MEIENKKEKLKNETKKQIKTINKKIK